MEKKTTREAFDIILKKYGSVFAELAKIEAKEKENARKQNRLDEDKT
jgi:hypothetical protein